jgi:nucleotide-binding universal stress UspA family protein
MFVPGEERSMRSILVATDGSDGGDRAIDLAADLAGRFGANLLIVHVVVDLSPMGAGHGVEGTRTGLGALVQVERTSWTELAESIGSDVVAKAKARAQAKGAQHILAEPHAGEPAEVVLTLARERGVDAIVVGRRGRGRLAGLLLGSVSQKVVTLARCPVVVVP